jgi:hypothetical protein
MYWVAKASLQKVLGYLPAGDRINYLLQRKVTKGLPVNGQVFREKVLLAVQHFNSFREHCPAIDIPTATFYEFGAGWDLIGPLTYYALGIEHQTLVDIRPNIRYELINDTLLRLSEDKDDLEHITGYSFRAINASPIASIAELKERFGITYLAPLDARDTNLQAESYDFISNTSTLEHISEPDILKILEECRRLLKSGGDSFFCH